MAIYHNSVSVIKRSAGKSAVAAAAYRSGQKLTDEQTGLTHDYTHKSGVDYSVVLSPVEADWITDRERLWNKVEAAEKRGDAQLAREITVAIPIELSQEDKIKLVCDYVQTNYVDLGMIADVNFHDLSGNNPHAHIMVSMRDLKINEQEDVSFGNKNRAWNHKNLLVKNREDWAKIANEYLIQAGYPDIQIDHRSNADRGIEIIPQIHLGIEAASMRKKGIRSELGDKYDRIEIVNNNIRKKLEQIYESESATSDLEHQLAEFDRQVSDREQDRSQFYEKIKVTPKEVAKPPAPEHRKTLEYQKARKKDWSEFYEKRSTYKEAAKPPAPVPAVKEKITLYQKTDPQLVRSILEIGNRLGTDCYQASNYHVQISPKDIEVRHQNNLAVIIGISSCVSLLIDRDRSFTLKQYEQDLQRSINVLITDLDQQHQADLEQLEQQPEQQPEPELAPPQIIIEDSESIIIDAPKIDTKTLLTKARQHNLGGIGN